MLLPIRAAHAGSWVFTCTGSGDARYTVSPAYGGGTYVTQTWNPPGPSTGSFSSGGVGATEDYCSSLVAKIQVTVTATWKPDPSLPSDPAPPNVWLCESSSADWDAPDKPNGSGTADDGVGPVGTDYKLDAGGYSGAANTSNAPASVPPAPPPYWKKYTVSGNTVALPARTIRGEADASGSQGGYLVAHAGSYSVTIHAQPYGWHDEGHFDANGNQSPGPLIDNVAGQITFLYTFRSTSGNIADLKGISVYEYIDYSGNPGSFGTDSTGPYYRPTSPPIGKTASGGIFELDQPHYGYIDPTVPYPRDSTGHTMGYAGDQHSPFPVMKPYSVLTITAPQKYEFDDPRTNEKNVTLYDPGSIVDAVKLNPNVFYISKSGYSVTSALPQ